MGLIRVPTLSGAGWVEDLSARATRLFEYFLVSEDIQTEFYKGNIASFADLMKKYGNKPATMADETETVLLHYFRRSFEQVDVNVTYNDIQEKPGQYNLDIDLTIREDDALYGLGALLELSGGELLGSRMKRY